MELINTINELIKKSTEQSEVISQLNLEKAYLEDLLNRALKHIDKSESIYNEIKGALEE